MKTQSSELLEDKTELKATLDFVTNENGELNEKLLELTTKLDKIESEKNELKNSADNEFKPPFEMDSSEDDSDAEDYDPLNPFNIVNPPTTQGWVKNRSLRKYFTIIFLSK